MQVNLKGKNFELTEPIKDYVLKRVTNLGKLLSKIDTGEEDKVRVNFEVSKTTNHHRGGDVFRADCLININGEEFYSSAEKGDLHQAIDEVKNTLFGEINKSKNKKRTMFHRGARKVKNILKGFTNWRS